MKVIIYFMSGMAYLSLEKVTCRSQLDLKTECVKGIRFTFCISITIIYIRALLTKREVKMAGY